MGKGRRVVIKGREEKDGGEARGERADDEPSSKQPGAGTWREVVSVV